MSDPKRIQRKRTKGWRMPEGAIYVGRPSRWGNPVTFSRSRWGYVRPDDAEWAVAMFRRHFDRTGLDLSPLRGKDLACWCPLDQPCHADVLLELANR